MDGIFRFFVENWRFSALVTLLTLIVGVLSLQMLRKESFPPVNFAVVTISTIYPGASPEEVQDKVTKEIETELRGIEGLKRVKSTSQSILNAITNQYIAADSTRATNTTINVINFHFK